MFRQTDVGIVVVPIPVELWYGTSFVLIRIRLWIRASQHHSGRLHVSPSVMITFGISLGLFEEGLECVAYLGVLETGIRVLYALRVWGHRRLFIDSRTS